MKKIRIAYSRKMNFDAEVEVTEEVYERIMDLRGQDTIEEGNTISWTDGVCSDDFTLIAEDLTSSADIIDGDNEISDFMCWGEKTEEEEE